MTRTNLNCSPIVWYDRCLLFNVVLRKVKLIFMYIILIVIEFSTLFIQTNRYKLQSHSYVTSDICGLTTILLQPRIKHFTLRPGIKTRKRTPKGFICLKNIYTLSKNIYNHAKNKRVVGVICGDDKRSQKVHPEKNASSLQCRLWQLHSG